MKFKKLLLPFAVGALAFTLAACGDEDKATKEETPKEKTTQEATTDEKEIQAKLAEQQVDESEIVAVVNDEELTGLMYNSVLFSIQSEMQQMGQDPTSKEAAEQIKKTTLDSLVSQTLIVQKAKEANLTASEAEIEEKYASIQEQIGGEEAMQKSLKAEKMDEKTLKEQIGESILFEKYQNKVVPAKEVTDKEIQEYYDQAAAQTKEAGQEFPPLEEVSEKIKGLLVQQQQQEVFVKHLEEIKADAKIELKI
ncbi:SurA N-terminal domain-containing protein [Paenisporosarcina indica]|uniref:SurA N-terminal domain-containing protein n=1 Tax=Paenisporosarcina indica TaxID=650093 RepID=UPI00094F7FB0|nr:SurA N-terminal domain-containing protein [Paenisporosarcina indica]